MITKLLFVLSLCMLAFFYGVAAVHYKIFPYEVLRGAEAAFEAWREVLETSQIYGYVDQNAAPTPQVVQPSDNHDDGYILVTGYPYALRSECPTHGCLAWIMNRDGEVLHSWEVDVDELWSDLPEHSGAKWRAVFEPIGLHLFPNGDLMATFQASELFPYGVGIAKFDRNGKPLWHKANFSHHWFSVAPDGLIYTPTNEIHRGSFEIGDTGQRLDCGRDIIAGAVLILDPDGEEIGRIRLLELLVEEGYAGTVVNAPRCDPIHLNYVEYVTEEMARNVPGLETGDLIVSMRELHMIAAIDGSTHGLKWVVTGRTVRQHSPRLMPDGGILVFDNWGGERATGGSRIVRLTYGEDTVETVVPGPETPADLNFWSRQVGFIDPHPDGSRALVALTGQGRFLEIDLHNGRVLWEYVNTHDFGTAGRQFDIEEGEVMRLAATGAYYVGRPAFLEDQP